MLHTGPPSGNLFDLLVMNLADGNLAIALHHRKDTPAEGQCRCFAAEASAEVC